MRFGVLTLLSAILSLGLRLNEKEMQSFNSEVGVNTLWEEKMGKTNTSQQWYWPVWITPSNVYFFGPSKVSEEYWHIEGRAHYYYESGNYYCYSPTDSRYSPSELGSFYWRNRDWYNSLLTFKEKSGTELHESKAHSESALSSETVPVSEKYFEEYWPPHCDLCRAEVEKLCTANATCEGYGFTVSWSNHSSIQKSDDREYEGNHTYCSGSLLLYFNNSYPAIDANDTINFYNNSWDSDWSSGYSFSASVNEVFMKPAWATSLGLNLKTLFALQDPKVVNMAGEHFEILQLGTFAFLSITKSSLGSRLLSVDAFIERAGRTCGATYISNLTLAGTWISEMEDFKVIQVRAATTSNKQHALELAFTNSTQEIPSFHEANYAAKVTRPKILKKATYGKIQMIIKSVVIDVTIDAHRIRDKHGKAVPAHNSNADYLGDKFVNFLNVGISGVEEVPRRDVRVTGLLAHDDHTAASAKPEGCLKKASKKRGNPASLKDGSDSLSISFLSTALIH